jgi:flagellar motor switch protein FliM
MADERLSQAELETLLATVQFDAHPPAARAPAGRSADGVIDARQAWPVDHSGASNTQAVRLEPHQLQLLQAAHDSFAAGLSQSLTQLLHARVEVKLAAIDTLRFDQFLSALENVTCLNVLRVPPLAGLLLLDQRPAIVFPMLDRMLGGGREPAFVPARPLTEIELRLLARLNRVVMVELARAWRTWAEIDPRIERVESRPAAARIVPGDEFVTRVQWDVTLESYRSAWTLCLPSTAMNSLWSKLPAAHSAGWQALTEADRANAVEMVAVLAETTISRDELANLCVGDIIATDQRIGTPISIMVDGEPRYTAQLGASSGHKAVRIESTIDRGQQPEP